MNDFEFPSPFNEDHFISEVVEDAGFLKFVEFPSPFNKDHFISGHVVTTLLTFGGFRPLLTRIISYR